MDERLAIEEQPNAPPNMTSITPSLQPPPVTAFVLTYPAPGVLLVKINKPKARNSISMSQHWEADSLFQWFDDEPTLQIAVITGAGEVAFCAGQDLKEQGDPEQGKFLRRAGLPPLGFAGLSKRVGKKPVIAAVNGLAVGGGFEICLNWFVAQDSMVALSKRLKHIVDTDFKCTVTS